MTIRTILIAENLLILRGITASLENDPDVEVVGTATGQGDLLESVQAARPDVVILDVEAVLPHGDPVTRVVRLKRVRPSAEVVALLNRDEVVFVPGLIKEAQTRSCLMKTDKRALALDEIVHRVFEKKWDHSQEVRQIYFNSPDPRLMPRELEILRLVDRGLTNERIAKTLTLSKSTVANHLSSIYEKLGAARGEGWNYRVVALRKAEGLGLL